MGAGWLVDKGTRLPHAGGMRSTTLLTFLLALASCQSADEGGATSPQSESGVDADAVDGASGSSGSAGTAGAAGTGGNAGTGGASGTAGAGAGMGGSPAITYPSEWLDLENWKLTLPVPEPGGTAPLEVLQPELASYSNPPYFHLTASFDGVLFRAHAGGATTSNSGYPRSELREMLDGGADEAAWSIASGVHTMTITEAITALPPIKPHVVAGQIHDASDDVVMIRLEGDHLFVEGGGSELGTLDDAYVLGTAFDVRVVADNGLVRVFYEDMNTAKVEVARDNDGCYFKAGVYTQSNPDKGDEPDAYGEVVIYALEIAHESP